MTKQSRNQFHATSAFFLATTAVAATAFGCPTASMARDLLPETPFGEILEARSCNTPQARIRQAETVVAAETSGLKWGGGNLEIAR